MLDIKIADVDISCGFSCYEKYLPLLSDERKEKIARLKFDKDKILSLFSGLLIRNEIQQKLGISGDKIGFSYNKHGKPFLNNYPNFHFSVSHSGKCAVIISDDCPIGIDIEENSSAKIEIAKRFFSPNEYKYILQSENPDATFYEIWTKKEAYLKMIGTGLATPLSSFDVMSDKICSLFYTMQYSTYSISICSEKIKQGIVPTLHNQYFIYNK